MGLKITRRVKVYKTGFKYGLLNSRIICFQKSKQENHQKSLPNTNTILVTQNTFYTSLLTSVSDGLRTAYDVRGGLSWKLFQS